MEVEDPQQTSSPVQSDANNNKIIVHVKELSKNGFDQHIEFEDLNMKVEDFKKLISQKSKIPVDEIRLLFSGRFLKDDATLSSGNVKNGCKILLSRKRSQPSEKTKEDINKLKEDEEKARRMKKILEATEELAKRRDGGMGKHELHHFVIENQRGEKVQIPEEDRKALIMAMTLHEKGKSFLKKKEYRDALDYFLLSDEYFKKCNLMFLQMVDNYAYVNLDIVWTYYKLQDPKAIYEAKTRLDLCEATLVKAHGKYMERLKKFKDGYFPELSLYCRLHLLKAIVAYHLGDIQTSKKFFLQAEFELETLKIDEEKIEQLKAMGFTEREARRSLRSTGKNVEAAAMEILEIRSRRAKRKEEERKRKQQRKEQIRLGKTVNGKLIDMKLYNGNEFIVHTYHVDFQQMGFPKDLVAQALKQSNNSQDGALTLLTEKREFLESLIQKDIQNRLVSPDKVQYLKNMGFAEDLAISALKLSNNELQAALDKLLEGQVKVLPNIEVLNEDKSKQTQQPPVNTKPQGSSQQTKKVNKENAEEKKKQKEIEEIIESEIATSIGDDDFMDIALMEEIDVVKKYLENIRSGVNQVIKF